MNKMTNQTMIKTVLGVFGLLVSLSTPRLGAAGLPDPDELAGSETVFELYAGVVVEPMAATVYLMNPAGGIDSVSAPSGELLWSTEAAAKPLMLFDDLLIAQAERATGGLDIVSLKARSGGDHGLDLAIDLPGGVQGAVDDGMGISFLVHSTVREGALFLWWDHTERYVKGIAPAPEEPLERQQMGTYRLDLVSNRTVPVDRAAVSASPLALPPQVEAWIESGVTTGGVTAIGNLLVATQVLTTAGQDQIHLKRWSAEGVSLPDITLFSGSHVLQFASADHRHLLVAERLAAGEFAEYEWSIFSLTTGERLGQVSHHQSHAPFFVSGNSLTYVERGYGRLVDARWVTEPRKLRTILLGSAALVWERRLRDTTYQGEYPP